MRLYDWQRKRREEKMGLKAIEKEATCERCGKAFAYHPIVGVDPPKFHSIVCKRLAEKEAGDGSG